MTKLWLSLSLLAFSVCVAVGALSAWDKHEAWVRAGKAFRQELAPKERREVVDALVAELEAVKKFQNVMASQYVLRSAEDLNRTLDRFLEKTRRESLPPKG
jgi:hypothetical protein